MKKLIALILAVLMCVSVLAACGDKSGNESGDSSGTSNGGKDTPLVVGYNQFNEKFSPFFSESGYDGDVASMTQAGLLTVDRAGAVVLNGIEGETRSYNGTDYFYQGIADVAIEKGDEQTVYTIKMRDDIKFSDGHVMDADDVIFSYYVLLDPAYTGNITLNSLDIVGYKNYLYNNSLAESISFTTEDIEAAVKDPSDSVKQVILDYNKALLESEYAWCGDVWEDYKEAYGVNSQIEFFIMCYNTDEAADFSGKSDEEVVAAIVEQYGADFTTLGSAYGADLSTEIYPLVEELLTNEKLASMDGKEVGNISGIVKLSQTEIQLTTNGFGASDIYQVGTTVAPMHYYGDEALYDYDNNKFGFEKGDLSKVESMTTKPMGAGPYKFVKYENKVVYFEANESYFLGAPKIKNVQFKETEDADKIPGVQQGAIDAAAEASLSVEAANQLSELNSNKEITGDVITTSTVDNLGYGYIGINAAAINVGGDPASEASRNLRRALATVMSAYRDLAVDSYYGDTAEVINYPISNTSWAAPQKSDADYAVAYSKDVDGKDIYTSSMTDEEKYEAALNAAVGFLKAAGYTFDDATGKFTAAPEGASLTFEATLGADGTGDHPNFLIFSEASKAFEKIGINFIVNDVEWATLSNQVSADQQTIWTMAWGATIDPDMYQVYHSSNAHGGSNYYSITDDELDSLILAARTSENQTYRKAVYKQCLDIILDWAVEIPVYQRLNCSIFSTQRVNVATITPDITPFYTWLAEIHNMEMN